MPETFDIFLTHRPAVVVLLFCDIIFGRLYICAHVRGHRDGFDVQL